MKSAIAIFVTLAAATTTLAVAQDGIGHGPPPSPAIAMPQLLPPTSSVQVPLADVSQSPLR